MLKSFPCTTEKWKQDDEESKRTRFLSSNIQIYNDFVVPVSEVITYSLCTASFFFLTLSSCRYPFIYSMCMFNGYLNVDHKHHFYYFYNYDYYNYQEHIK
jgi:hypothetical protein